MELIILLVILIIVIIVCRSFRSFIYAFAIADIILRIVNFICSQIKAVNDLLYKIPSSVEAMIKAESSGTLQTVLLWVYVALYVIFLSYLISTFFLRRTYRRKR